MTLDDEGDDLLDVPRPPDVPGAVDKANFRGPGGPLLVVVRHHHTGEERLVSGRAWIGRFDPREWGHIAFVPATEEAVRLSRDWARSPSNVLGRRGT